MPRRQLNPADPRAIACKRAIAEAGGYRKLAEKLGITRQATFLWQMVPVDRCFDVESITGISVDELRPDFFGRALARRTA